MAKLSTQMTKALAEHGSRLPDVDGIGPVVATRLLRSVTSVTSQVRPVTGVVTQELPVTGHHPWLR